MTTKQAIECLKNKYYIDWVLNTIVDPSESVVAMQTLITIAERVGDGIYIDKYVAKKWADEMLAQAKYARLSPQSVVDVLNELRKGLLNGEGKDGGG